MENLAIKKITRYLGFHFTFLKKVYLTNNYIEDTTVGNETFLNFISVDKSNKRIDDGSSFYEVFLNEKICGIFEIDENHLTLLFIDNEFQKKGIGTFSINRIKSLLKNRYSEITIFASPYSIDFYLKYGFLKESEEKKMIKGMNYYSMTLKL